MPIERRIRARLGDDLDGRDQMQVQADRLRGSEVLGRSGTLLRLFEFLLEQSLAGQCPKEFEVAVAVFGKDVAFDGTQDAIVRVYIHKLRRRLDEHYARATEPVRLVIPKGEYRLCVEPTPYAKEAATKLLPASSVELRPARKPYWLLIALALSLTANLALLLIYVLAQRNAPPEAEARNQPLWSSVLDDELPIYIAVGNYYIFGELDDMEVRRLIREFNINSQDDLQRYTFEHPDIAHEYINLNLSYLPTATAFALRELMPLLMTRKKRLEIVLASDIDAQMLKSAHIIYIGYLSGMGRLQELAFKRSRFSIGETYDELFDHVTKTTYVSQAGAPLSGRIEYHDYGYLSSLVGPNGNHILIVAGTRDVAVMHSAEILTNVAKLQQLSAAISDAPGFEALYEVSGIDQTNVNGRLLVAAPLASAGAGTHGED